LATKFEDMSNEEKQAAFQRWLASRESRKGQSAARRKATQQIIAAHKGEYNKLLKAAGGTVKEAVVE